MIGKRFKKLIILKDDDESRLSNRKVVVQCDCGNLVSVRLNNLKSGNTKSCGCSRLENRSCTHNQSNTRLYTIWLNMKARCKNKNYKYYGGKGIVVEEEWNRFEDFYKWAINNGYADNLVIDRLDSNKNYSSSNCQWITFSENSKKMWDDLKKRVVKSHHIKIACVLKTFGISYSESARNFNISPFALMAAITRINKKLQGVEPR